MFYDKSIHRIAASVKRLERLAQEGPRFENQDACPGCQFLGQHGKFDLWSCVKDGGGPTYMARRSDEISDYSSMSDVGPEQKWPYGPNHPLSVAKELHAQMRGMEHEPDETM